MVARRRPADPTGPVTGLPLPRYASLKTDRVNLREGPSKDHATKWVFQRAGLPVEITAEFDIWRKVRDSEGAEGWVLRSLLSGRRTGLVGVGKAGQIYAIYQSRGRRARWRRGYSRASSPTCAPATAPGAWSMATVTRDILNNPPCGAYIPTRRFHEPGGRRAGVGRSETTVDAFDDADFGHRARRLRVDTLIWLRWLAISGQSTAIVVAHFVLGIDFPVFACFLCVGASALLNAALRLRFPVSHRLDDDWAAGLLGFDVAQLAALLALTGGLANPFSFLFLAPMMTRGGVAAAAAHARPARLHARSARSRAAMLALAAALAGRGERFSRRRYTSSECG